MYEHLLHEGARRVQFREAHVLDLLDDVVPIDVVHTFPARDTAEQGGLAFRPGQSVTVVKIVGHTGQYNQGAPRAPAIRRRPRVYRKPA